MKRIITLAVVLLALIPAIGFAQEKKAVWQELKAFHSLMSSTFHPAEEGNLAPLKEKAAELLVAAKKWQKSEIPASFKKEETMAQLKKLTIQCGAVQKAVEAKMNDEELKKRITEAHDIFHKIVGECRKAEE